MNKLKHVKLIMVDYNPLNYNRDFLLWVSMLLGKDGEPLARGHSAIQTLKFHNLSIARKFRKF